MARSPLALPSSDSQMVKGLPSVSVVLYLPTKPLGGENRSAGEDDRQGNGGKTCRGSDEETGDLHGFLLLSRWVEGAGYKPPGFPNSFRALPLPPPTA